MSILFKPASLVWAVLMFATCASTWWVSKNGISAATATTLVVLIAALKVRLILIHFMELGHAPLRWRLLFEGWNIACLGVILTLYFQ